MEKLIESYFNKQIKLRLKGMTIKGNAQSMNGIPDRIVFLPEGKIFFAELKDKGKKPRPIQLVAHRLLRKLGFRVYVIDSKEQVDEVIQEWKNTDPMTTKT